MAQSKEEREGAEKERSKKRKKDKKARKKERKEAQRAQEEWDSDEASKTDVATAGPARVDCGRMARFSRLNSYAPPLCQHDAGCRSGVARADNGVRVVVEGGAGESW